MKRLAEYRFIGDPEVAAAYRRSFRHYDEPRLLISLFFYAIASALFSGVFIVRYQLELIVPLFLELNATRQLAVDSILVDAPKKLRAHWAALAAGTGGRSIAIEL